MAQIVKLRRSSVSGQKPTNSNLQLGELALNTTDGKVFMAKSGSLGPSVEELISTNTVNTGSIFLVGDITASIFTGSFKGDGINLYNIPASGVTGLQLDKIVSGNASASIDDTGLRVNRDVYIDGNLNVDSITGSIDFSNITNKPTLVSGSSQISYTGITNVPNGIISGSLQIVDLGFTTTSSFESFTSSYNTDSQSFDSRINTFTASINSLNSFSSSVVLTSQTSSMTVLSASYAVTAAFALNAGGVATIGSYASLEQTTGATTWSFVHNTGQRYPIFQVFNGSGEVIIPTQIRTIDENIAEIIFGSEQTGTAIASLGGGNGTTQEFNSSALWTVDHNLNTDYPDVTIWDSNRNIIFPNRIESVDSNQIKVYFSVPVSGHVSVSRGGHILLAGETGLSWNDLQNKPSGLVSGSSQVSFGGITDKPSGLVSGSSQISFGGISDKPSGLVSGSSQILYTSISNIPSGIVSGSEQLTGSYDTRYLLSGNITGSAGQVAILGSDKTISGSLFTYVTNQTFGLGTAAVTLDEPERLMVDNFNSYNIATFQTSQQETYAEVNIKNFGSGSSSSADLVLWNNVTTPSSSFLNLGINSSNYNAGYVGYGGDGYLFNHTNDLYLGSTDTLENGHGHVHIFGGGMWDSSSISVYSDGTIGINTDKENTSASTIPSSVGGYAIEISGSVNFRNDLLVTGSIVVIGDVDASSFNTTSDKLLKTNLERIEGALDKIEQLNGYTFDWIDDYSYDKTRQIGMIANEVHAVQPELTSNRTIMLNDKQEEILLLDYSKVTVLLIEAVKELSDKVKKLEDKLISNGKRGI